MIYAFQASLYGDKIFPKEIQGLVWGRTMGQAASNVERTLSKDVHLASVKLEKWDNTEHGVLLLSPETLIAVEED